MPVTTKLINRFQSQTSSVIPTTLVLVVRVVQSVWYVRYVVMSVWYVSMFVRKITFE